MTAFNRDLAILFAQISHQAYKDKEEVNVEQYGFNLVHYFDSDKDIQAILVENEDMIVIAFRGTDSFQDVVRDLRIVLKAFKPDRFRFFFKPKVHDGFFGGYRNIRNPVRTEILRIYNENNRPVYVTGHSLGGALATLMVFDLNKIAQIPAIMYNYGSPRVGNRKFTKIFHKRVPECYRIVNDEDPVPSIPFGPFSHIGTYVLLDDEEHILVNPSLLERVEKVLETVEDLVTGFFLKEHGITNYLDLLVNAKDIKIRN